MSMLRKRSAQYKVHLPSDARENQYILAKIRLTDELLAKHAKLIDKNSDAPFAKFYDYLSQTFFSLCDEFGLDTVHFIAKDKYTRVRYSPERLVSQTEQQIVFLYNPKYHVNRHTFVDAKSLPKKITLVFLANGVDLRHRAADFHQRVMQAVNRYGEIVGAQAGDTRVCDHQHLTYDLFAKQKGLQNTQAHKLRAINQRYRSKEVALTEPHDELTYAVVDCPVSRRLLSLIEINKQDDEPYYPFYAMINNAFTQAAKQANLKNCAIIANGLVPFVREAKQDIVVKNGELQLLGYNPANTEGGITCKWDANKLVDTIQFIFVAGPLPKAEQGYGRFLHQVEVALQDLATELKMVPEQEELIVRFHQHIGFYR